MNLMSSTLLTEDTGVPFDELQAEQIALYRAAWKEAGWEREPRVSVSRSILPIATELDREYFGAMAAGEQGDQVGYIDGGIARFGKSFVGEPDAIVEELVKDAAVRSADTVLMTVPNQHEVAYVKSQLESSLKLVAPGLGWRWAEPATNDVASAHHSRPMMECGSVCTVCHVPRRSVSMRTRLSESTYSQRSSESLATPLTMRVVMVSQARRLDRVPVSQQRRHRPSA